MPLHFYKRIDHFYELAVWKIVEQESFFISRLLFTAADEKRLSEFQNPTRRLEWLATRYLIRYLLNPPDLIEMGAKENRKPFISNLKSHVSISHCRGFAAVMVSDEMQVGVDIEGIHPRIKKIAHKFVNEVEEQMVAEGDEVEKLSAFWSLKESVFKAHGEGELVFADEICIQPTVWPANVLEVELRKPGFETSLKVNLKLDREEEYVLTWVAM